MGEVYRARDTRLDRTVAIKVLPSEVADDPDLRSRFEREARAVAALDHPHICGIYDVGSVDSTHYLVMPHLEGQTLAARLEKGPLPLDQALKVGVEITDALDKAHRQGIIHRDLKPANIMLTKAGAKLLDFGLAKLRRTAGPISMSGITRLATRAPETAPGMILGTVHYMAPEQVEGREADARTDVWALGALLYEMATGKRPFDGDSAASVIGAILKDVPPPVSTRAPLIPRELDRVVERCLAKDPDERWQSAGDVGAVLRWIASSADEQPAATRKPRRAWREYGAWSLAAILLTLLAITIIRPASGSATPPADVVVFSIYPPPGGAFRSQGASVPTPKLALAPDGRHLVFLAAGPDGVARLWLRPLDAAEARPLAGTEDATDPFWSPDSRNVAFFARGALQRVDLNGGAPQVLSNLVGINTRGGSWGSSGVILFNPNLTGLRRVAESGGTAVSIDSNAGNSKLSGARYPSFVGDSGRFLFQQREGEVEGSVYMGSLDAGTATPLVATDWGAHISVGFLLFLKGTTLMAQAFGPGDRLTGDAVPLRTNVAGGSAGYPAFSTSTTGILAYANPTRAPRELRWFSRGGTALDRVAPAADYVDFRLSPDETRLAYSRVDPVTQAADVWVKDLRSGADRHVVSDSLNDASALWSPEGDALVYRSNRGSRTNQLYRVTATGVGGAELVLSDAQQRELQQISPVPTDWSASGAYLVYQAATLKHGFDLWAWSLAERKAILLKHSLFNDLHGSISPDSRWLAYASDESGQYEVYVQAFPGAKEVWTISTEGGSQPRWTPNGRELLYLRRDGTLMSLPIETSPTFVMKGIPAPLFKTGLAGVDAYRMDFVPSADGKRILMSTPITDGDRPAITVVLNWPALLKR
jgi:eukaryotic-like serine/threonine-protein kinase